MTRAADPQRDEAAHEIREGVRAGILAALHQDAEQRGGRTARLLAAAGALGAFGAIGATLLLAGHSYGHHPSSHVVAFAAVWSGLLVVSLALAFLDVRAVGLPIARSIGVALVGLGVAGVCGAACPDPHFLAWWIETGAGARLAAQLGPALSVACFGVVAVFASGAIAAFVALGRPQAEPIRPLFPAVALFTLLAPGLVLQAYGERWSVFSGWLLGAAAGAYLGVALGMRARAALSER